MEGIIPPLVDTADIKEILGNLLPGIQIVGAPKESGQRLVYFANFEPIGEYDWSSWGECVVKVMQAPTSDSIARFQREIRILGDLRSQYYPKHLYNNIFKEDPITEKAIHPPWFITIEERLPGRPLSSVLGNPLPEFRVAQIGLKIIEALEILWADKKQYVHRDLNPENILIDGDEVKVIDLGIVREAGEVGLTNDFAEAGPANPKYCSPEQSINDKANISYKSDLFTLGILFYEMLSGLHPFWDETIVNRDQMFRAIREKAHHCLCETYNISPEMKKIVDKLISKKPFERYRRIDDLKCDLKNIGKTND